MDKEYPFYYEIAFRFLAFDSENNVRLESHRNSFKNADPLIARQNVFHEFNEYLGFKSDSIKKNQRGNYIFTQPLESLERFDESISIYLVISDEIFAREILDAHEYNGIIETKYLIHRVSSYEFEDQDLINNLEFYELKLYEHFNIDIGKLREVVYHYGVDYAESGEDVEGGAKRVILKTPYVWATLEEYKDFALKEANSIPEGNDYSLIISRGESHQVEFKPSLLYNFKTRRASTNVRYIIAKGICSFLNSDGGVLFIGVADKGKVQGLDYDFSLFPDQQGRDKVLLALDSLIASFFGVSIKPLINSVITKIEGKEILLIIVDKSAKPIFLEHFNNNEMVKEFFIRMNASTHQLKEVEEIIEYVFRHEWKKLDT